MAKESKKREQSQKKGRGGGSRRHPGIGASIVSKPCCWEELGKGGGERNGGIGEKGG